MSKSNRVPDSTRPATDTSGSLAEPLDAPSTNAPAAAWMNTLRVNNAVIGIPPRALLPLSQMATSGTPIAFRRLKSLTVIVE